MKNMKPAYRNGYRIYLVLCMSVGIFMQSGKPHPDYLLGWFYGLVGSWIVPGMVAKALMHGTLGVVGMLATSSAFWLILGKMATAPGKPHAPRGQRPGGGIVLANPSEYDVLPNLPPGLGYYTKPTTRTSRTTYYMDEEG